LIRPHARLAALVAVPALLWGCASPNVDFADAQHHYAVADYYQAYVAVTKAREFEPDDPAVERAYWKIRQAYLLSEAQRLVFANREPEAMEFLERVLALDPENEIALRWKRKALDKLSDRAVDRGDRLMGGGDLQGALAAFDEALRHDAGNLRAREGIDQLGALWRKTQGEARGHYIDGVRALGDYEYRRTSYHLGIAIEKDPTLAEAEDPLQVASRQLAEERYAAARGMEEAGYFRSALREYRSIADFYPESEELAERTARAELEAEVEDLADAGEMAVYRGDFARAREVLDAAFEKTARQKDRIAELLLMAREREIERSYVAAKDLELQHRLEDAALAFAALEESMPGFRDVRARIADLQLRIEEARAHYASGLEAQQNDDLDGAIAAYTDVQLFWQGYLDSRARLEALRKQKAAAGGGG
jgi:tetratricopeptide (TPR) repeat protein